MKFLNEEKLNKLKLTRENMCLVIDFDKTITSDESEDSWSVAGKLLGKECNEKMNMLYNKYRPIELDYTMLFDEKRKHIEEWYKTVMQCYRDYNLTKSKIENSIIESKIEFRPGAKEFLIDMYKNNVPVVILSAGIGNIIELFLKIHNCYTDNIFILSNFIEFDVNGDIFGLPERMIHSLNKTMTGKLPIEFAKKVAERETFLLIGDLIEDRKMVDIIEIDRTLSIGFLTENVNENIEAYKKSFDILLTDEDARFDVIDELI